MSTRCNMSGPLSVCVLTVLCCAVCWGSAVPCAYEICQCDSTTIDCSHKNLTALPPMKHGIFTQTRLDISYNNISSIQDRQLPPRLESLICLHTALTDIQINSLNESSQTLKVLDISFSRLARLPWELMELLVLRTLTMTGNPAMQMNPSVISALGRTVETLTLDDMGFTVLPSWITKFKKLRNLNVRHNNMTTLGLSTWFDLHEDNSLPDLEHIDLSYNEIDDIDDFIFFRFSKKLASIFLMHNKIDNIDAVFSLDGIEKLYLNNNRICNSSRLSFALYPHRNNVNHLYIDYNCLTDIPDLSHLVNLQTLSLQNNQIVDQTSLYLPASLRTLHLYGNRLTRVPKDISSLTDLTNLGLSNNKITSLESVTFPSSIERLYLYSNEIENITSFNFLQGESNLVDLLLEHNPITHISPETFKQIPKLTSLDLSYTRLTRIPLALKSLTHLTSLDLSHNPGLVCTCEESSLVTWYSNLTLTLDPGSDCDGTTVDFFLGHLAANCPQARV